MTRMRTSCVITKKFWSFGAWVGGDARHCPTVPARAEDASS